LDQNDLEKIGRYINGMSDDNEKEWVESLFLNGENNSSLRQMLEKDWEIILKDSSLSGVNLNYLLDKVYHSIRQMENIKKKTISQRLYRIYMNAAAIFLLPLLITGGLFYCYKSLKDGTAINQKANFTIFAPFGSRVSFSLPDGTTGMLNSGSTLCYSLPFTNNRQVKLEGEAWMDVNQDMDHPFEISVGNSTLKVLGTRFNVNAYPEENFVEVVLKQGKLEFQANEDSGKVTILPSERLVFKNGNLIKSPADPSKYAAWTEGKLVFRGDPMVEVARRIERWYNVKVYLADKELEMYSFRAIFLDDSLTDVLRFLSMTSPIRYRVSPRELLRDGTYKKEEVTIYLKK
jgi:transmembrane sensor